MKRRVILQPRALEDINEAYLYLADRYSPESAARWYNGLIRQIESLEAFAGRCGLARENDQFEQELRELLYNPHGSAHRVIFTIRDDSVRVLCVRHAARQDVSPAELSDDRDE